MKISTAYLSEKGGREYNDDTVCIMQDKNKISAFVGDGLGAYAGGKIASLAASDSIMEYQKQKSLLSEQHMSAVAAVANEAVKRQQECLNGSMKTTVVVLAIEDTKCRWMHVGDSRLYYFQNGKLKVQTMDHSVSQVAVLMGEISQEEIRFHEDRNRVLRALGSGNAKPDISPLKHLTEKKEAFLLCTDGFWEYVYEKEMESCLQAAKNPAEWLKNMRVLLEKRVADGNDNFSAIAIFCEKEM